MPDIFGRPLPGERIGGGGSTDIFGRPIGGAPPQQEPTGFLGSVLVPTLDFLSRGQYASAGFFDALINDNASVLEALSLAGSEILSPVKRKSFTDVITRANPTFASENPTATKILGFLGDVALDPTTYIGLGLGAATKGARIGAKALTPLGEALQIGLRGSMVGREVTLGLPGATREAAQILGRETLTRLPQEIAQRAAFGAGAANDLVRAGAESIGKDLRALLGGSLPKGITEEGLDDVAARISLERLGVGDTAKAVNTVTRKLGEQEITESADRIISRLASLSPEAEAAIFKPRGVRVQVGIPFTTAQAESPELLRFTGLDHLGKLVDAVIGLPGIKQAVNGGKVIRGAFDRFYDINPRYFDEVMTPLENQKRFVEQSVIKDVAEMEKVFALDKSARERVSRVMNGFQAGVESLPDEVKAAQAPLVFQVALRQAPLQPKEQALVMSLMEGYARKAELENAALVAGQSAANFDPRVYRAISDNAEEAMEWMRRIGPDGALDAAGLDAKMLDKASDLAAAVAEGANVSQDALLLYASKAIAARQALPKLQARGALEAIFNTSDPAKLPRRVANDWRYFGDAKIPTFGSDEGNEILRFIDGVQRLWKGTKTVLNPGFGPKQAVQNSFQSALVMGNNAYRAFDPRVWSSAAATSFGLKTAARTELPESALRWLERVTGPEDAEAVKALALENLKRNEEALNFGKEVALTTPAGKAYSNEELDLLERQLGIDRGTTGYTGEVLKRSLQSAIGEGRPESFAEKAWEGTKKLANSYLGLASKFEDTSRRALFRNGLLMGDSPAQAAQRVNRALFDYQRGQSKFEQEVMRRLVPFYSFNRFAIPFALRAALENPGAPATANKALELVSDLLTADKDGQPNVIGQGQREMFMPKFLIDQPRLFKGFSANGEMLFNTINNMTPFDALSLFTVTKKNGGIDWQATAEKNIGGMLTPFLKVPAEVVANRESFTQKVIEDAKGGRGRLGAVKDSQLDAVIPDSVKEMIGWEWGMDRRSGKQIAFVNPWFAYTMAQLAPPVAKQFINLPDLSGGAILELAMKQTLGIGDLKVDPRQSLAIESAEDRKYLQELRARITTARRQGRIDSADEALEDYRKVLRLVAERSGGGGA